MDRKRQQPTTVGYHAVTVHNLSDKFCKNKKMGEVINEISQAIQILGLNDSDIYLLDKKCGQEIFDEFENYYVNSENRRWWWEDFKQNHFTLKYSDKPFELLKNIIPTTEKVWFMVEDDQEPFYPIYDTKPEIIGNIIGECFAFEYYVMDKNKKWLICETHHGRLLGIGEELKTVCKQQGLIE